MTKMMTNNKKRSTFVERFFVVIFLCQGQSSKIKGKTMASILRTAISEFIEKHNKI